MLALSAVEMTKFLHVRTVLCTPSPSSCQTLQRLQYGYGLERSIIEGIGDDLENRLLVGTVAYGTLRYLPHLSRWRWKKGTAQKHFDK